MKEQLMNMSGDFTWDFGQNFFIENADWKLCLV